MFMAVEMGQRDAARLNLANLCFGFALDFFCGNLPANCREGKLLQAGAEARRAHLSAKEDLP